MTDTPDLDPSNPATDRVNRASELLRTWPVVRRDDVASWVAMAVAGRKQRLAYQVLGAASAGVVLATVALSGALPPIFVMGAWTAAGFCALRVLFFDGLRLVQWQKRESAETAEVERGEEFAVLTNSQLDRVADEVAGCAEALDTLKRWRANPKLAVREHDARLLRRQSIAWSDYQAHAPR
jgi:hypothetical protein